MNNGQSECALEGPPGASLVDGAGTVLIGSTGIVGGGRSLPLMPGFGARLLVSVHNWCNDPPRDPVSIGLTMPNGTALVAAPASGIAFESPPCMGPGQPATIEVSPESWTLLEG